MANAQKIIAEKGDDVVTISPEATVLEGAKLMNERRIGALVVLEGEKLVGMFTERDLMLRIVAAQRNPATTKISEVMTTTVACASPETILDELRCVIRDKRIRHIPVIKDGKVRGLISIGDLNRVEQDVQERTIQYLEQYMSVP